MKKSFIFFVCAGVLISNLYAQTLRRVGFTSSSTPVTGVDYATLQAAHDAAVAGDTIQVYPFANGGGGANYSGTFNKRLVVIGPGHMYNTYNITTSEIPNAGLQALTGGISSINVTLATGSTKSSFTGINGLSIGLANALTDSINDIVITRCRNLTINLGQNNNTLNNWFVSQCLGFSIQQSVLTNSSFSGNRTLTNWRIENCIGGSNSFAGYINLTTSPLGISSLQILNCTLLGSSGSNLALANQSVVIQNCIIEESVANNSGLANTVFINNITGTAQLNNPMFTNPGSSGNLFAINIGGSGNVVLAGYPTNQSGSTILYAPDARFKLTTSGSNPAKNAGLIPGTTTATDCGAYGGTNPYKDSGIPAVPAFYRFNSASGVASGTTYPVTFSVRSNN